MERSLSGSERTRESRKEIRNRINFVKGLNFDKVFLYICIKEYFQNKMTYRDFVTPPTDIPCEKWQLGSLITNEPQSGGVALLFVTDYRGNGGEVIPTDFHLFRECFYSLSRQDYTLPIADLGELRAGKTFADTLYIVEELVLSCLQKNIFPVVIGGSDALSYALFSVVNSIKNNVNYSQIASAISFKNRENETITNENYLSSIFHNREFSLKEYHLLGYQKHLNDYRNHLILEELDYNILRLGEMMGATHRAEPFFRNADLVTLNCDAVESIGEGFSVRSQVNGLNSREICSCMRDIGLAGNLKSLGIFNFNLASKNKLHYQLLAQMVWYFLEGLHIQRTHPKERNYETFMVMLGEGELTFKRDTFSNQWYFGKEEDIKQCIPCTQEDYENAKRGILNKRWK